MLSLITPERISILLETLSFFLVTTDLFGNKRLERIKQKILTANPNIELDDDKGERIVQIIRIICIALVALRYGIDMYSQFDEYKAFIGDKFGSLSEDKKHAEWIVLVILFAIVGIIVYVAGLIISIPMSFLFFIVFYGKYALLILIKKLLKITTVEGLLLLTGTIIFLISRVLSFIYSN